MNKRRTAGLWVRAAVVSCGLIVAAIDARAADGVPIETASLDGAALAHYRAANAALGPRKAGEQRIVFFGDSITEAWIGRDPAYFSAHGYIDRGISGQTTTQMRARFEQDVIALAPRVVLILAGTNDIATAPGAFDPRDTQRNLQVMVERAQASGIRVVLASLLPAADYPWRRGREPAPKIRALNDWLDAYAKRAGAVYLDYYAAMADARGGLPPRYSDDGVHPNRAGYAVMEPLAEQAIRTALAMP